MFTGTSFFCHCRRLFRSTALLQPWLSQAHFSSQAASLWFCFFRFSWHGWDVPEKVLHSLLAEREAIGGTVPETFKFQVGESRAVLWHAAMVKGQLASTELGVLLSKFRGATNTLSWGHFRACLGGLQMENTEKEKLFTTKHLASFPLERFNWKGWFQYWLP